MQRNTILCGDALSTLRTLPSESVQCCITSPPYYSLRDYGVPGQIGLESSPREYIEKLVEVFREIRRVLRSDGTCWLNLGDSYATTNSHANKVQGNSEFNEKRPSRVDTLTPIKGVPRGFKNKNLMMIPARVAIALCDDGWYLRSSIIWHKLNAMPESVTDRPTSAHEHVFLLAKSERYFYDSEAIKEPAVKGDAHAGNRNYRPYAVGGRLQVGQSEQERASGRNKRNVWTIASQPYGEAHFATMPPKLVEPCILAGSSPQACEHCAAPWQRVTDVERSDATNNHQRFGSHVKAGANRQYQPITGRTTTGWQPTCTCPNNTGSGRCIVLDPFMGAGTVALVALQQNRDYLGIELNPEYIKLANKRIATIQPVLWTV